MCKSLCIVLNRNIKINYKCIYFYKQTILVYLLATGGANVSKQLYKQHLLIKCYLLYKFVVQPVYFALTLSAFKIYIVHCSLSTKVIQQNITRKFDNVPELLRY